METRRESEINDYIQEKEQLAWNTVDNLESLKEEIEDWFLTEWVRNDAGLLTYADLAMKDSKLSFWESVKIKLLDLKLSLSCSYFSDFKNFLNNLKHWNPSSHSEGWSHKPDSVDWSHNSEVIDWKVVDTAIQTAMRIVNDNSYWYERWWTGDNNSRKWFDCQSFVRHCFIQAGIKVDTSWWCPTMREQFTKAWFEWISPYDVNNLQRWDILLDENKHTELYIWDGKTVWAHWNKDGKAWDGKWNEISVTNGKYFLYTYHKQFGWDWILRYKWKSA